MRMTRCWIQKIYPTFKEIPLAHIVSTDSTYFYPRTWCAALSATATFMISDWKPTCDLVVSSCDSLFTPWAKIIYNMLAVELWHNDARQRERSIKSCQNNHFFYIKFHYAGSDYLQSRTNRFYEGSSGWDHSHQCSCCFRLSKHFEPVSKHHGEKCMQLWVSSQQL